LVALAPVLGLVYLRQRFVHRCHGGWQRSSRRRFNRR
jgi:hypothetical protein